MAHKYGFLTIQQRMEVLADILAVVPAASVSALAKRQLCSESTIRNALNYMLSIGQVTRRQENEAEMWKRIAQERKHSYMKSPSARPQWLYSLGKGYTKYNSSCSHMKLIPLSSLTHRDSRSIHNMKTILPHQLRAAVADLKIEVPANIFLAMTVMLDGYNSAYPEHGFSNAPDEIMTVIMALNPDPKKCAIEMNEVAGAGQDRIIDILNALTDGDSDE